MRLLIIKIIYYTYPKNKNINKLLDKQISTQKINTYFVEQIITPKEKKKWQNENTYYAKKARTANVQKNQVGYILTTIYKRK